MIGVGFSTFLCVMYYVNVLVLFGVSYIRCRFLALFWCIYLFGVGINTFLVNMTYLV